MARKTQKLDDVELDDVVVDEIDKFVRLIQAKDLVGDRLGAQILRGTLAASPDEIRSEYGCSPEEATIALVCCELAELAVWDLRALVDAATVCGSEEQRINWGYLSADNLTRKISLAIKAENTPEVISPAEGVLLLKRAGIHVLHQLVEAVAVLQIRADETIPMYRVLMGIDAPKQELLQPSVDDKKCSD
jgi:hypothetical protein